MVFDYSKLKGLIIEKYGSQNNFARKIGISNKSLSLNMTGKRRFSISLMDKCIKTLEIEPDDVGVYFFTPKVQ